MKFKWEQSLDLLIASWIKGYNENLENCEQKKLNIKLLVYGLYVYSFCSGNGPANIFSTNAERKVWHICGILYFNWYS